MCFVHVLNCALSYVISLLALNTCLCVYEKDKERQREDEREGQTEGVKKKKKLQH